MENLTRSFVEPALNPDLLIFGGMNHDLAKLVKDLLALVTGPKAHPLLYGAKKVAEARKQVVVEDALRAMKCE